MSVGLWPHHSKLCFLIPSAPLTVPPPPCTSYKHPCDRKVTLLWKVTYPQVLGMKVGGGKWVVSKLPHCVCEGFACLSSKNQLELQKACTNLCSDHRM